MVPIDFKQQLFGTHNYLKFYIFNLTVVFLKSINLIARVFFTKIDSVDHFFHEIHKKIKRSKSNVRLISYNITGK